MQKVTKKMYDKELHPFYGPLKLLSYLITTNWGLSLIRTVFNLPKGQNIKGLKCEQRYIPSKNGGPDIRVRIFRPDTNETLPAMLYIHGGGYIIGNPENFLGVIENYIHKRPCVIVAPDYRKSNQEPYPAALNDCYDTLLWMKENAESLGINSDKFAVAGHSAGGGLTAAVTLKACDTGDVNIAVQMPIYPMIDHRQNTESAKTMDIGVPAWNARTNAVGWGMYLQNVKGEVPAYASPSLGTKYQHLPPTITFVGELEPFKDETINYVEALKKAGVPVKFEVFEAAYHGFEIIAQNASVSKRANKFHYDSWAEYYDKFLV